MFKAVLNIFRIVELRNRVLFTLAMIAIYRIGFWIPLVGVDQTQLEELARQSATEATGFGKLLEYVSVFSGGSFKQSTIFGLGHHALYHRIDHLPVAAVGGAETAGTQEGRCERSTEDY